MRSMNPSGISDNLLIHNSVYRALQSISFGSASAFDTNGQPTTFDNVNTDTAMIRVGSLPNPNGLPNFWFGTAVDTTIAHNLGRVPIGYYIVRKSIACDVYDGFTAWTDTEIFLQITNSNADTTLVIF